jgi:hypothetical protein
VALLIGGWLVVSLPHDDSLCSRQGAMLTQLDAVHALTFTSRHLFQVEPQTRYNTQFLHSRDSNTIYMATMPRKVIHHDNLIQAQPNRGIDQMGHQPAASGTILTFGMSWCSLSVSSFVLNS